MPDNNTLRGLPGLNRVSAEERDAFLLNNAEKLKKYENDPATYDKAADILYNNQLFKKTFGVEDNLKQYGDYNQRLELLKSKTINDAFERKFKNDQDYSLLKSELDEQGMLDLLESDYMGSQERQRRFSENMEDADASKTWIGKGISTWMAQKDARDEAEDDVAIRNGIFAEVQKRREQGAEAEAADNYLSILDADTQGVKSLAESYEEFDKLATQNSPHYATFKDSKWLEDYTHEERLKDYAKYQALTDQYGEGVAKQYLDRTVQDRVAAAQDGKWTGNTLKGVLTTIWSDLGSNVALLAHVRGGADRMAVWNQGKDPDKPIYDNKGNVIDFEKNDNWVTNPAYWNDVYKYNTFTPTEIKAIEERGGISEDTNIKEYGYTPDFFSWDTFQEGFKQGGHVVAGIVETGFMGGVVGKGAGLIAKGAMKAAGLSTKAMAKAAKVGAITNDLFVGATTGLEGAQLEAMGTFEELMQTAREKIQDQIRYELQDYSRNIDYNSNEAKAGINSIYQQLKAQDLQRVATENATSEVANSFPLSDEFLMEQAKRQYTNQLLEAKNAELTELHKKDEVEMAKAASKAYGANFILDYIKNVPLTLGIQKFKVAKGSMRGAFDNTIAKNIVADAETGGVKKAINGARKDIRIGTKKHGFNIPGSEGTEATFTSAGKLAKETIKQLGGGFADEYLDGINASAATGFGSNEFDNYINRTYNPEAYYEVTDTVLGNMLSGLYGGVEGLSERQNWYEGFIGMVAPFASVTVNPNMAFNPKDTWKALVEGKDSYGNDMDIADRISTAFMNPLLASYSELNQKNQRLDNSIKAINTLVAAKKDQLQDASAIIAALNDYSKPIDTSDDTLLTSKDKKLNTAFTIIDTLNTLENIEGGTSSALYQSTMDTMKGLAEGTLSDNELNEEVDRFLADPDNKSILDMGQEVARQTAAERLQKNAQYFMDMKQKMDEVNQRFSESPSMYSVPPKVRAVMRYNIVASDDYKKRLDSLEDKLGVSKTDTETLYIPDMSVRYQTSASIDNAIKVRDKILSEKEKEIDTFKTVKEKAEKSIEKLKKTLKKTSDNKEAEKIQDEIIYTQNIIDSTDLSLETLNEEKKKIIDERKKLSAIDRESKVDFTEASILGLDARDRAAVLDEANERNYTPEQQAVIRHTRENLLQKDPEALSKIKDMGTLAARIEDTRTMYNKVLKNDKVAENYINAVERLRTRYAMAEALQEKIDNNYSAIEQAYSIKDVNPTALKESVLATDMQLMEAYMEDHPEHVAAVQSYVNMLKIEETAAGVIKGSNWTDETKQQMLDRLHALQDITNNEEEYLNFIEAIIDSPETSEEDRKNYSELLDTMELMGLQRDVTVVESRKQRLEREAAIKQKEEEEKLKEAELAAQANASKNFDKEGSEADRAALKEGGKEVEGIPDNVTQTTPEAKEEKSANASEETPVTIEEWSINPDTKITKEVANNKFGGHYTEGATDEQVNRWEQVNLAVTVDYLNGKITDEKYLEEIGYGTGKNGWLNNASKEDIAKKAQEEADARKPYLKHNEKIEVTTETSQEESATTTPEVAYVTQDEDGNIQGNSPTLEEQMKQVKPSDDVQVSEDFNDAEKENDREEEKSQTSVDTIYANPMEEWIIYPQQDAKTGEWKYGGNGLSLSQDKVLIRKKGKEENDSMNRYFAWMDAAGIKLQNIIDDELPEILEKNPHAKVKIMTIKPVKTNATHDEYMLMIDDNKKEHVRLMLVLDYDDKVNPGITTIHHKENGGIIPSGGKDYLLIGSIGYGNEAQAKANGMWKWWSLLNDSNRSDGHKIPVKAWSWFNKSENKSERFYVDPDISTEVALNTMIPGWLIHQNETDTTKEERRISELLEDPTRNPHGLTWDTLAWGIQYLSGYMSVNTKGKQTMVPKDKVDNAGRVFVLVPAGNGKLVAAAVRALHWNDSRFNKNGALYREISDLLRKVTSANYKDRYEAVSELSRLFYFSSDKKKGDNILIGKENNNIVSVIHDGNILFSGDVTNNFNFTEFLKAIGNMNPRINITLPALQNIDTLKKLDEAGALMVDIAKLGTSGIRYRIYGINESGEMVVPAVPVNTNVQQGESGSFNDVKTVQITYNRGNLYSYNSRDGFTLNGKPVEDSVILEGLQYALDIQQKGLVFVKKEDVWKYYIIDESNNEVVRYNDSTNLIERLSEEDAKNLIQQVKDEEEQKKREQEALEYLNSTYQEKGNDVSLDSGIYVNPEGQIEGLEEFEGLQQEEKKEEGKEVKVESNKEESSNIVSQGYSPSSKILTFNQLWRKRGMRGQLLELVKAKKKNNPAWSNVSETDANKLYEFLNSRGVPVDTIGTSDEDFNAWLHLVDCA